MQGITFDQNGSLYVTSNKKKSSGEVFRVDKYLTLEAPSSEREKINTLSGHGQGIDYINGLFYYGSSSTIKFFDDSFNKTHEVKLDIVRKSWMSCGGNLKYYACVENDGAIHILNQITDLSQKPKINFNSNPGLILNSNITKKHPVLQGVEVYENFLIVYRGGFSGGKKDYLWLDVFDIKTEKVIYQKRFQAWTTQGIPEKFFKKHEAEGISVFEGKLYLGMMYVTSEDMKDKKINSILVDEKILLLLDDYLAGNDIAIHQDNFNSKN